MLGSTLNEGRRNDGLCSDHGGWIGHTTLATFALAFTETTFENRQGKKPAQAELRTIEWIDASGTDFLLYTRNGS